MSITIGDQAPPSTWKVAWQDGAAVTDGRTISLADCHAANQVVMLYVTSLTEP